MAALHLHRHDLARLQVLPVPCLDRLQGEHLVDLLPAVDVSDTLNPPSVVMAGQLIIRVGLATNKPAEFIILRIAADTRALDAELAAASN